MKGFKKDGKFIPTGNKSKSSLKKSDIRKKESVGTIMTDDEVQKAKKEFIQEQESIKEDDLGLTDKKRQYHFGFSDGGLGTDEDRAVGNNIIHRMFDDQKNNHPEVGIQKIDTHIYNTYNSIQHVLSSSEDEVNQLIEWKNDGNPKTWKWEYPIVGNDGQNRSWETDAYKDKVIITLMSPTDYLNTVSPRTLLTGKRNDIRGEEHTEETIDMLTKLMMDGKNVDTAYLIVSDDNDVFTGEGQHRALSAIKAGIELMPVYIYKNGGEFSEEDYQSIPKNPMGTLKPDLRSLGD